MDCISYLCNSSVWLFTSWPDCLDWEDIQRHIRSKRENGLSFNNHFNGQLLSIEKIEFLSSIEKWFLPWIFLHHCWSRTMRVYLRTKFILLNYFDLFKSSKKTKFRSLQLVHGLASYPLVVSSTNENLPLAFINSSA